MLNTPLHLAVKVRCAAIASVLLEHGASTRVCNIRGDVPTQWYMLPRMSQAANVSRRARLREGIFSWAPVVFGVAPLAEAEFPPANPYGIPMNSY